MADPYATLGVNRQASEKDIKSAYRKLAKELHPDRNTDNPKAAERFSEVTRAYDLLSDKDKRARFDRGEIDADGNPASPFGAGFAGGGGFGARGFGGGMGGGGAGGRGASARDFEGFGGAEDLGDLFEGLFGRGGGGARGFGGADAGAAGAGAGAQFGRRPPPSRGADISYRLLVPFIDAATRADQRITLSDGSTIDLKLPTGLTDGTQVRLKGKGQAGPAGPGDAIVKLEIQPHALFTRDGDDVRLDLPITLDEAVAGAKVRAPTVDGPVMLTIAPGSSSGKVLRLKGKGFTAKDGGRGDQLVALSIALPDDPTELATRLEGWRDESDVRRDLAV